MMDVRHLEELLDVALKNAPRASDVLLSPGSPVLASVLGELHPVTEGLPALLTEADTAAMARALLENRPHAKADHAATGSADLALALPSGTRLRANVFLRLGATAMVFRRLPDVVPTAASLGLPRLVTEAASARDGLVVVAGSTGSGKSTTLAALIDAINQTRAVHVITLEDPVEYLHAPRRALVTQRELGQDFQEFASGLRAAMRQAPRVILVGEIRDRDTAEAALRAAETGHLVLCTVHSTDCGGMVSRLAGLFEPAEERFARTALAGCLRVAVAQRLAPTVDGARTAVFEVMAPTLRVREMIVSGETEEATFSELIAQGKPHGMIGFPSSLGRLLLAGRVTEETVAAYAADRAEAVRIIDAVRAAAGKTDAAGTVKLEIERG
ncbi:type IV pilus twitching motility protein PilT [Desulfolutivibrio sulfoxidireducens]|uniref:type IV pilus twitching motility protein PilT n=1 Tax=Desulfolutivibrio sulfoxidireducens TaxID=2773299 RepID=UPI00159E1CCB|nr:PilT/PilU family type 4a pilus ATPase [Desulfolutivibrio sulfoxidireducens]QLA15756.1 PilT/PilU family type 4a pilus ATPase [Desulfolutivibrio sulfoxidireducens]